MEGEPVKYHPYWVVALFVWLIAIVILVTYAEQNDSTFALVVGLLVLVGGAIGLHKLTKEKVNQ